MRNIPIITITLLCLCIWGCKNEKAQEEKEISQYTIEEFYNNINYSGGYFSHDESKLLVSSNATGIYNLYALHTDGTVVDTLSSNTEESWFANSYFPNDDRILLQQIKEGMKSATSTY